MEEEKAGSKDWLIVAGLILAYGFYFVSLNLPLERNLVHVPLDDRIPFCEFFIIPYFFWYFFISVPLLYFYVVSREDFLLSGIYLLLGIYICMAVFLVYPSEIAIQPTIFPRQNIFTQWIKLLYAMDRPQNVFPSLHCFESAAVCVSIWKSKVFPKNRSIRLAALIAAVLICLSTVLIKQHSAADLICGVLLAVPLYFIVYKIKWPFKKRFE